MLRLANEDDLPQLIKGYNQFVEFTGLTNLLPLESYNTRIESFKTVIGMGNCDVLVVDINGALAGGIVLVHAPYVWDLTKQITDELAWFCYDWAPKTTALKLIRGAISLSRDKGSDYLTLSKLSNSPQGVHNVYDKLGASEIQSTYLLTLT